jgi:DNA-binding response OmpR family regulator
MRATVTSDHERTMREPFVMPDGRNDRQLPRFSPTRYGQPGARPGSAPTPMRVLVVEDYPPLARSLQQGIEEAGYAVDLARDGEEALLLAEQGSHDAVVLDLMIPKIDGLAVLERLRLRGSAAGVLVLTAKDTVEDRVRGLDLGADDYLVKPFAFLELLARLRSVIRRRYGETTKCLRVADLEVDTVARAVTRGGAPVTLSAREYALLEYLAARRGQVVSRSEILEHVYDFQSEPASNVVDVYIGYLRRKIDDGRDSKLIHTRRGIGYILEEVET